MKIIMTTLTTGPDEVTCGDTEEALWKTVGEHLLSLSNDGLVNEKDLILIKDKDSDADAALHMEGDEDGRLINVTTAYNHFHMKHALYEKRMLRKLDPETNAHWFYDLVPNNLGTITCDVGARFGKLGEQSLNMIEQGEVLRPPFTAYLFWPKYYCLLAKGYEDMTEDLVDKDDDPVENMFRDQEPVDDESEAAVVLYQHLIGCARNALSEFNVDFLSNKLPWNRVQLNSCRRYFDKLSSCKSVAEMNDILMRLIGIFNPKFDKRKGITVSSYLIPEKEDEKEQEKEIARVINEWEARINAMEAVLGRKKEKDENPVSPFGEIQIEYAPNEEKDRIRDKFHIQNGYDFTLYKIDAPWFNKRFDDYCQEKQITDIREFIHGSSAANWVSIITNGLLLNPNAPIHGKAYGNGIYTARDFNKSLGYTDYHGSKWQHGTAENGYIGVYRTGYGKALTPKGVSRGYEEDVKNGGYNCLDAVASYSGYRMDEIVFYEEAALTPEYLIEFHDRKY